MKTLLSTLPCAAGILIALAACSSNSAKHDVDAGHQLDGSGPGSDGAMSQDGGSDSGQTCVASMFGAQDIVDPGDDTVIVWGGPLTNDLGDGGSSSFEIQFYGDAGMTNLGTTVDLAAGAQANFSTCSACLLVLSHDANGGVARTFYQSGGTLTLTQDPLGTKHLLGSTANLAFTEVTIDPDTYVSTPVSGGKCLSVGTLTLDKNSVPNAWTCGANTFNDGTTCNCMCGALDPDCGITNAPVLGCTGQQYCSNDACVTPPANDTC
ncbi:MAG: uncharacterized protein JWO36_4177, partial [Myxococcales bacterium]|nr:uncharacterized protein [Myxococcales bacterium]